MNNEDFYKLVEFNKSKIERLHVLGVLNFEDDKVRDHNIGDSDYSKGNHLFEPWSIWLDHKLNPWDDDIIKRILRKKSIPGMTPIQSRIQDYEKIKHICDERLRQLSFGFDPAE